MVAVLDELGLTDLVCSIKGLSAVGAAAILAETGDPTRFGSPPSVVKHAGLAPRERASGAYTGRTRIGRAGRPGLRLAAWRAAWVITRSNPVYAARFSHLTTRADNRLSAGQARAAIAAALLRHLHVVVTRREPWNPRIAASARRECQIVGVSGHDPAGGPLVGMRMGCAVRGRRISLALRARV